MTRLDWDTEIRPVLVAAYRALDDAGSAYPNVESADVNAQLGREPDDERQSIALEYLDKAGYSAAVAPRAGVGSL